MYSAALLWALWSFPYSYNAIPTINAYFETVEECQRAMKIVYETLERKPTQFRCIQAKYVFPNANQRTNP
jgi:hypothetical protein